MIVAAYSSMLMILNEMLLQKKNDILSNTSIMSTESIRHENRKFHSFCCCYDPRTFGTFVHSLLFGESKFEAARAGTKEVEKILIDNVCSIEIFAHLEF